MKRKLNSQKDAMSFFNINTDCIGYIGQFLGGTTKDICLVWSHISKEFLNLAITYWQKTLIVGHIHFHEENDDAIKWARKYAHILESANLFTSQAMNIGYPKLKFLNFHGRYVPDLSSSPLLTELHLYDTSLGCLTDLHLSTLEKLGLFSTDMDIVAHSEEQFLMLKSLYVDSIHSGSISSVFRFAFNLTSLRKLHLCFFVVSPIQICDVSKLCSLTSLKMVCCGSTTVHNLDFLAPLTALECLKMNGFQKLIDIYALQNLTALRKIDLKNNYSLRNISSLQLLAWFNLVKVNLCFTSVSFNSLKILQNANPRIDCSNF